MTGDYVFSHLGGSACLDLNNTVSWRDGVPFDSEHIETAMDLVRWARSADLLDERAAIALAREAEMNSTDGAGALRSALALRQVIHRLFAAVSRGDVDNAALADLNGFLGRSTVGVRAEPDGAFRWDWTGIRGDYEGILFAVAWSAAQLLTSGEGARVKRCASDTCGWLFVDRSRRRNRRWCDMKDCGNRAKARRYYQRQRAKR